MTNHRQSRRAGLKLIPPRPGAIGMIRIVSGRAASPGRIPRSGGLEFRRRAIHSHSRALHWRTHVVFGFRVGKG